MKVNKKVLLQQFLPLSDAEIQSFLHPAQVNLGYFLARIQSFQLHSESPLGLIPLAPKSHVSFEVCTQL
jgi:hypothetical protein